MWRERGKAAVIELVGRSLCVGADSRQQTKEGQNTRTPDGTTEGSKEWWKRTRNATVVVAAK